MSTVRCENPECGQMVPAPENAPAFRCPACGREQAIAQPNGDGVAVHPTSPASLPERKVKAPAPTPLNMKLLNCPSCGRWVESANTRCPLCQSSFDLAHLREQRNTLHKELMLFYWAAAVTAPAGILLLFASLFARNLMPNYRLFGSGPNLYYLLVFFGGGLFWTGLGFGVCSKRESGGLRLTLIAFAGLITFLILLSGIVMPLVNRPGLPIETNREFIWLTRFENYNWIILAVLGALFILALPDERWRKLKRLDKFLRVYYPR